MRVHLAAWGAAAVDLSAGLVTVANIPGEQLLRFSSNVLQLSDNWNVLASYFGGVGLARVRLNSAASRIRGFPNMVPFGATTLGGSLPPVMDARENPIQLYSGENVTFQATNGAANNVIGLVMLGRGDPNFNVNTKGLRWIRFTAAVTTVAFSWGASGNVVLDDDLEAGRYNVYSMITSEADCIAARLIFKDQVERPGFVSQQALTDNASELLKTPSFGIWGAFDSITPPFIEPLHVASAAQSIVGYLLVGKA